MTDRMEHMLPVLDEEPEEWGPDHDELDLTESELFDEMTVGNTQGFLIDIEDDEDNGLQQGISSQ